MYENSNILPDHEWQLYHNYNKNSHHNNYTTISNNLLGSNANSTNLNNSSIAEASSAATVGTAATKLTYYNDNYLISDDLNMTQIINYNDNITDSVPILLIATEIIGNFLSCYYTPILVFTGSIGNILSVFVFFKTKLKKLSSSYYLSALAISDTCFLIGVFTQWLNFVDIYLYNREILCQFFTFFSSLCSFLSVWFVVAFTVERFIAVMYPLKRQTMCTVKRAKIVLLGLTLLGIVHCAPLIYFASPRFDIESNATICDIRWEYKHYMTIINYVDTVVVFVVPFTTIVVLNTFTGCIVWKFATVRRTMTTHRRKQTTQMPHGDEFSTTLYRAPTLKKQTSLISNCSHPNGKNSIRYSGTVKSGRRKMTNTSQLKVTKMLLIVSTVFICLNLPSYAMRVRAFLEIDPSRTTIAVQYICYVLFLTNFGINFVIYCLSGQNFRRAVISIFRKQSSNQKEGVTQVTVISGTPPLSLIQLSKLTASEILKEFIDNYKKLPALWSTPVQASVERSTTTTSPIDCTALNKSYDFNEDKSLNGYIKLLQLLRKINNERCLVDDLLLMQGMRSNYAEYANKAKCKYQVNIDLLNSCSNTSTTYDCASSNSELESTIISKPITDRIELLPIDWQQLNINKLNDEELLIKAWENKLKQIPRRQRLLAESAINEILIKAEMCILRDDVSMSQTSQYQLN